MPLLVPIEGRVVWTAANEKGKKSTMDNHQVPQPLFAPASQSAVRKIGFGTVTLILYFLSGSRTILI